MASKSLGTLTLDLVAKTGGFVQGMDKASRKSQKTAKQIERYSNQIGAALTAASAAAVTGIAAMVVSTSTGAREVQNLARQAGATPQEFQKAAYGAKRYGIEQEKLSDILKDTNDRIGDFIQTGGGPMADFFENIAPKVGVTAAQFKNLSGPDALQLYVSSLEKANVSQADMTFYMEALAGDSAALWPLLINNGKGMKTLGDEAERTGNVFSDLEFEQLGEGKRGLDELTGAATGMKNEVVLGALPAINDLIDLLSDESTMKSAQALGTAVVTAMNKAAQAIDGTIKITQFLAEELAAMTAGAAADDIVRLEDELGTLYSMLDNPTNRVRFFGKDGAVVYYNKDEIWDMIAETENKIVNFRNNIGKGSRPAPLLDLVDPPEPPDTSGGSGGTDTSGGTGGAGAAADAAKKMADNYASVISALNPAQAEFTRYADQLDMIDSFNISAGEKEALREESFRQHQERMIQISQEGSDATIEPQMQGLKLFTDYQQTALSTVGQIFGNMADIAEKGGEKQFSTWKAMATAQAVVSTALAVSNALASAPPPFNFALAATVGALGAVQVAQIQGTEYQGARAMGGSVTGGGSYMVGENGPEVVTMGGSGVVTPSSVNNNGGTTNVTQVFQLGGGGGDAKREILAAAPFIKAQAKQAVLEAINQGGAMSRAVGRRG